MKVIEEGQDIIFPQIKKYFKKKNITNASKLKDADIDEIRKMAIAKGEDSKTSRSAVRNAVVSYCKKNSIRGNVPDTLENTSKSGPAKTSKKQSKKTDKKADDKSNSKPDEQAKKKVETAVASIETKDIGENADQARQKSQANPIQGYSIAKKMYFVHRQAERNTVAAIDKLMKSAGVGEINVKVTNTAVTKDNLFDLSKEQCTIGIHVILDNATVHGLRKLMAVLSESKQIDENIIGDFFKAVVNVGKAAKDATVKSAGEMKKAAIERIETANEELKHKIGIVGIKTYIAQFAGPRLAEKVDDGAVFTGINQEDKMKGRISYYTTVTL